MSDSALASGTADRPRRDGWINRLAAHPGFQAWAARFPLTRRFARADGAAIFEIVQGFVKSQALFALVETGVLERLARGPMEAREIARTCGLPRDSGDLLLRAGAAMGLLRQRRSGWRLTRRGAALTGVPGLTGMILHHSALYRDLTEPSAFLRGETDPELARFWPYVLSGGDEMAAAEAERYSRLMTDSQALVAADTLDAVSLAGVRRLLDVGGGSGAFLAAAARRHPGLELHLMDLPEVCAGAPERLAALGIAERVALHPGSFRADDLPQGADLISLIRVLYDHEDATVRDLLAKAYRALPPGGRLLISEPMSGGVRPDPVTDLYFAFYTRAMGTGRTRSAKEICSFCREAGFDISATPAPRRSYVTTAILARKP